MTVTQTMRQQPLLGSGQCWKVVFYAGSALMAAHATMDTTTRCGIFYAIHAKGLQAGQSL
jgi:hypothetical protein